MKKTLLIISCSILLAGCGKDAIEKEKEKIEKISLEKQQKIQEEENENKEFYEKMSIPVNEILQSEDLDKLKNLEGKVIIKNEYEEPKEFALFTAQVLFELYNAEQKIDSYYNFINQFGSEKFKEQYWYEKESENRLFISNALKAINKYPINGEEYQVSDIVHIDEDSAYFYRKVKTNLEDMYYTTYIEKEDGKWKYVDDGPSSPYEEINFENEK